MIEPVPSSLSYEGPLHSTKRSYSCPVHCSTNIKLVKLKYDSGLNILRCLFFRFRFYSCSYVFKTEFIVAMKFVVCQMPLKPQKNS